MPEIGRVTELTRRLVKIDSLTPDDKGCQKLLRAELDSCGFKSLTLKQSGTDNLLSLHGSGSPFLLFLGHTDVVPPGKESNWIYPPFKAEIAPDESGSLCLYGRGSADMKGSDAAMVLALADFVKSNPDHKGTVGVLITSNEEGDGKGGVAFVASYLKERGLIPDFCIVGEPSSGEKFGDTVKNGRRGSMTAVIEVKGEQGHVAYPQNCVNAAHKAAKLITLLSETVWDEGSEFFPPTSFQVTNLNCGTGAENVVPGSCSIMCNWRFNSLHTPENLQRKAEALAQEAGIDCAFDYRVNGLPFITKGGDLLTALTGEIEKVTGIRPALSTSGGTSDGRFIAPLGTQTVEFGPLSATIHKANEHVSVKDLEGLREIFLNTLKELYR